jgi:membrane protein required for colicin V production
MHWLDTMLILALLVGAILGFVSGLFWQVARIASLALAVMASILCHATAAQLLRDWLLRDAEPSVVQASAYVTVFIVVYMALFLVTRLLRMWIRATDLALFDRFLGAGLGAVKIALLLGVGCLLLQHAPQPSAQEWLNHSTLAPVFAQGMESAAALVPDDCKQPVLDSFRQLQEAMLRSQAKAKEN